MNEDTIFHGVRMEAYLKVKAENTALKKLLQEKGELLNRVSQKSVSKERPDWYCELCGNGGENGRDITELTHEKDCPIPDIQEILSRPKVQEIMKEVE